MPFIDLAQQDRRTLVPGYAGVFIHTQGMTLVFWTIEAGAPLPEHAHPHEQVATVTEGQFELTVDGETRQLGPGQIAVIPPNAVHSGRAVTACQLIDVFHPVREDYR
jgi:quercetin dioxygenase-like cupin family protein